MSTIIRINDSIYERLRALATPFDDTPATVIERLLDFYDSKNELPTKRVKEPPVIYPDIYPEDNPPSLTHTHIISASFAGRSATGWNELVHMAHQVAMERLKSFHAVRSASLSNIVEGVRTDSGFHFLADANLSIQNVDANKAWQNSLHLAKKLAVEINAVFEWAEKEGAAHPGKQGQLYWK